MWKQIDKKELFNKIIDGKIDPSSQKIRVVNIDNDWGDPYVDYFENITMDTIPFLLEEESIIFFIKVVDNK